MLLDNPICTYKEICATEVHAFSLCNAFDRAHLQCRLLYGATETTVSIDDAGRGHQPIQKTQLLTVHKHAIHTLEI